MVNKKFELFDICSQHRDCVLFSALVGSINMIFMPCYQSEIENWTINFKRRVLKSSKVREERTDVCLEYVDFKSLYMVDVAKSQSFIQ